MLCGLGELGMTQPGTAFPTEMVVLDSDLEPGTPFSPNLLAGGKGPVADEDGSAAFGKKKEKKEKKKKGRGRAGGWDDEDDERKEDDDVVGSYRWSQDKSGEPQHQGSQTT